MVCFHTCEPLPPSLPQHQGDLETEGHLGLLEEDRETDADMIELEVCFYHLSSISSLQLFCLIFPMSWPFACSKIIV